MAKEAHEDGVAVAVFPELCLTGYAIDDLLLQDTLLDATHAAIAEVVAASADLRPVLVVGAPLVHGTRVLNCAVVIHRGRDPRGRAEVATCRPTASSTSAGTSRPATTGAAPRSVVGDRRVPVRAGPDLPRDRRAGPHAARRDLRGHVGADPAERRGLAGRRDGAGQPLRQPDHGRPGRGPAAAGPVSASARCSAAYVFAAAGQGESTTDLSLGRPDDGLRVRRPARRGRAVPRRAADDGGRRRPRPAAPGADPPGHVRRQPADLRRPDRGVPDRRVRAPAAVRRHRPAPQGRPVPVRARRPRAARAGLLRGLQHPGLRARAAAVLHRRRPRW